jgi:hypothetical protein
VPGGGLVVGGGLTPGGAGTPGTATGPEVGVVSLPVMGLVDSIRPPTPVTTGKPVAPVGVEGWEETADDPGGWLSPLPRTDPVAGVEVGGVPASAAPATGPPTRVHPGAHDP